MNIKSSVTETIGATPLIHLQRLEREAGALAQLVAKVEFLNPTSSAKDRPALEMIDRAEADGLLPPGGTIIEPTSGNTGVGLAAIAAARGYRAIIVMADSMSMERRKLMAAFGAELVLTPGALGMQGCVDKARELQAQIPGSFIPDQFGNPANADAHYKTTGPEIWKDTDGQIDILVASVGTGGTLTGTARYLKEQLPGLKAVAVEPAASPLLSQGRAGSHKIQGIGANFVPEVLDRSLIDEILPVSDEDAYACARLAATREGLLVGISSGAVLKAAMELAARPENQGKRIVAILTDTGERYLSTEGFIPIDD